MTHSPWAREYARTPDEYIWGMQPSAFARQVRALVAPGARVLDLGCGEGRDSVYFAACGCDVTGVDVSAAGLAKARRLARAHGVAVRWVQGDVARAVLDGPFDLVYSCGAIHYVARPRRPHLFRRLKALTRAGGHAAHLVFTDRHVYVELGEEVDYFAAGELRTPYADWRIVGHAAADITCSRDGVPHHHSVEELVARKV